MKNGGPEEKIVVPSAALLFPFTVSVLGMGKQGAIDLDETIFCPLSHQTTGHQCSVSSLVHCSFVPEIGWKQLLGFSCSTQEFPQA